MRALAFLWLPLLVSTLAHAAHVPPGPPLPVTILSDATDDASFPASDPLGPADIRSLQVLDETAESLTLGIDVGPFSVADEGIDLLQWLYFNVQFAARNFSYSLRFSVPYQLDPDGSPLVRIKSFSQAWGEARADGHHENMVADVVFDDENDRIRLEIQRYWLQLASVSVPWKALWHGDEVRDFVLTTTVRSAATPPDAAQHTDRAPDSGTAGSYVLRTDPPSSVLQVRMADDLRTLPVAPGGNHTLRFMVANLHATRELINLTYEVRGMFGQPTPGITVWAPSSVLLPGTRWRNYTAHVEVPESAELDRLYFMQIRARMLSTGDTAYGWIILDEGHAMGPRNNQLFFHVAAPRFPYTQVNCDVGGSSMGYCGDPYLSERRAEEGTGDDEPRRMPDGSFTAEDSEALSDPVSLAPDGRWWLNLSFASRYADYETDLTVEPWIRLPDARTLPLMSESRTVRLMPEAKVHTFQGPMPREIPPVFAAGSRLGVTVLHEPASVVPEAGPDAHPEVVQLLAHGSDLSFPFVEVPEVYRPKFEPSPFQLIFEGEREEFVNPGEHHLFNLTAINLDADEQRLRLEAEVSSSSWNVTVLPPGPFAMPRSAGLGFGVLVGAPADAGEGERVNVTVRALADDGSVRTERMVLTATNGADLADQRGAFLPDEEAQEYQIEPPAPETPHPGLLAFLLAALLAVASRRRGRTFI